MPQSEKFFCLQIHFNLVEGELGVSKLWGLSGSECDLTFMNLSHCYINDLIKKISGYSFAGSRKMAA